MVEEGGMQRPYQKFRLEILTGQHHLGLRLTWLLLFVAFIVVVSRWKLLLLFMIFPQPFGKLLNPNLSPKKSCARWWAVWGWWRRCPLRRCSPAC
jgi:hypothetical protein